MHSFLIKDILGDDSDNSFSLKFFSAENLELADDSSLSQENSKTEKNNSGKIDVKKGSANIKQRSSSKHTNLANISGQVASANSASSARRHRKARTAFTDHQLQMLESDFERQKYLSVQQRMEMAARLNLTDTQVKTWYQNRRTKWKRQSMAGFELYAEVQKFPSLFNFHRPLLRNFSASSVGSSFSELNFHSGNISHFI